MSRPPLLPPSASVAHGTAGARLYAPAAARNSAALTELLLKHAPRSGTALELASGTGEHVCAFAAALPGLHWTPSEPDATRRASIDAHVAHSELTNIAPAAVLDATDPDWGGAHFPKDLIVLVNLLHLIPTPDTIMLIQQAAAALAQGGTFIVYGPFKRSGTLSSPGDEKFDAELRAADPAIGYKDDLDIARWLSDASLSPIDVVEMPANNLSFIAGKPSS